MYASTAALAAAGVLCCALSGCSANGGGSNVPTVPRQALQDDISRRLAEAGAVAHCDVEAAGERLRRTVAVSGVRGLKMEIDVVSSRSGLVP